MYNYKNYTLSEFKNLCNSNESIRNNSNFSNNQYIPPINIENNQMKKSNYNSEIDMNYPNEFIKKNVYNQAQIPYYIPPPQYYYPPPSHMIPYGYHNIYDKETNHGINNNNVITKSQPKIVIDDKNNDDDDVEFVTKSGKHVKFKSKKKKAPIISNDIKPKEDKKINEKVTVESIPKLDNKDEPIQTASIPEHKQ